MSSTPLADITVLDLSKVLAGPLCAQYLGDMGADVIKVEAHEGDETRTWPPFRSGVEGTSPTGTVFISANRNKRSISIDLRTQAGREVIYTLAEKADVVIASFGPGVAGRLGVGAETLMARNPRLVYCSISGFGSVGPMSDAKGYDVILQSFCGMLSITGERDGGPVRSPFSPVDQVTGMHALTGILAALIERTRTGHGALVEASLFDSATGFLGYYLQAYWERGTEPAKVGSGHESLCPYEAFETTDKPVILGVANDSLWRAFCKLVDWGDIVDDPRFRTNADRVAHRSETVERVRKVLKTRSRDEWMASLAAVGIPCSPLHTLGELSSHPHMRASGMLQQVTHPQLGELTMVSQPIRFDGARTAVRRAPPLQGEHGREILRQAGLDDGQIESLGTTGAVKF